STATNAPDTQTGAQTAKTTETTGTKVPAEPFGRAFLKNNPMPDIISAGSTAAGIFLIFYLLRPIAFRLLRKFSKKTKTRADDMLADLLKEVRWWWVLVVALAIGALLLVIPPNEKAGSLPQWARVIVVVTTALQFLLAIRIVVNYTLDFLLRKNRQPDGTPDPAIQNSMGVMRFIIMVGLSIAIVLVAMENLGIKVTPLLTGLGIGGIAVALAVQNILGDVFASLTIVLDKPFQVGDAITVGDKSGTVERIGIKTTRLRATSGEELVFGNSDLLSSRVQNFKRMQERRVAFTLGLVYELSPDKLRRVPQLVKESVESASKVRFDRCHFKSFGAYSLDFECVYFVTTSDYLAFMDAQQAINLAIFERFEKEGIDFAYPTQAQVQRKA
ncbi:MAG TPA: mechanosensitive ion channel family protein, partial [Phycisphaerales bacterium]|nr:mechanosensitive ion channel family protein [Phycisphaerales bacterium]